MNRRQFARHFATAVIAIPAARLLAACTEDEQVTVVTLDLAGQTSSGPPIDASTPTGDMGAAQADMTAAQADMATQNFTFTSTNVLAHVHMITLEGALFSSPPAAGVSRDTSINGSSVVAAHSHTVVLTQAQLQMIASGVPVSVDTGIALSHTHTFTFTNM